MGLWFRKREFDRIGLRHRTIRFENKKELGETTLVTIAAFLFGY